MLPEERLRVGAFLCAVASVYLAAGVLLLRRALQKRERRVPSRLELRARRVVFALAVLGVACLLYARFVEPYWPEVTHVRITSIKLQHSLRIVHLSDVHSDPSPRLEERLPALVRAEHPDLIVFTGDSLNTPRGLPVFRDCMSKLAQIAPTFAVRGNWDVWYWHALDLFGGTGVHELDGSATTVALHGDSIWIGGLVVDHEARFDALMQTAPADALRVLLHHYPDQIFEASRRGVDLYLAGHTHGGQVALPFYGALVTFSKFGKRFERGLSYVGGTALYVTRGIGMEGGSAPRVRFWARPEITVIDVEPARQSVGFGH